MPNTLAHIGVQVTFTRAASPGSDVKWIYLGCIIPDVPWMLQRVLWVVVPELNRYDLRLYCIVQGSLALSLILCGALAAQSRTPRRTLAVLAGGSLLHLLLDALQIRWGQGVHLIAPYSWRDFTIGWFWPDSVVTYLLTTLGIGVVVWFWWRPAGEVSGSPWRPRRLALSGTLLLIYLTIPLAMRAGPAIADSHFTQTLRNRELRAGKAIALDRARYVRGTATDSVVTYANESIALDQRWFSQPTRVSLRGRFIDSTTVAVEAAHDHAPWPRDVPSYAGLTIIAVTWIATLTRNWRPPSARWQGSPWSRK